ncbi:MAG: hypothetical protein DBX37_00485 [Massilioclostridium sp.]|nr:MAG: hypothetical protein DBX37_00485 [Massilioclostridium sp.]
MAYISFEEYTKMYGDSISMEDFPVCAEVASNLIDNITQYRIVQGGGFSTLSQFLQCMIQKATAAQVFYFSQIGLETVLTGQTGQSFTVGKVSVSGGALSNATANSEQLMISPLAKTLLEQTPLMERGVHVCSDRLLNLF